MPTTELSIVIKTVDQSSPAISGIESTIKDLVATVGSLYILKKGFDELIDSMSLLGQEQSQMNVLKQVIEDMGGSWADAGTQMEAYIANAKYNSLFTSSELIPAMTTLINSGMNSAQAMKAMNSVMELASARHLSLETSALLLGKAYDGNTTTLQHYGIQAKDFNEVIEQINGNMSGATLAAMDSYDGVVKKLDTTWENFRKTLAKFLEPDMSNLLKALDTLLGGGATSNNDALPKATKELTDLYAQQEAFVKVVKEGAGAITAQIDINKSWVGSIQVETKYLNDKVLASKELIEITDKINKLKATATTPTPITFDPKERQKDLDAEYKAFTEEKNKEDAAEAKSASNKATIEDSMRKDIDTIESDGFLDEIGRINLLAQARLDAGMNRVVVEQWATDKTIEQYDKAFNIQSSLNTAMDTMFTGSAEQKKYLIEELLEAEAMSWAKKFAWIAVEKLLTGDFAGSAIAAAEAVTLGYTATLIQADIDKKKADDTAATTATTTAVTVATAATKAVTDNTVSASGGSSTPSSVASASTPQVIYVTNSYNLNAGIMMGDIATIDKAFQDLMTRYDQWTKLVRSGA